MEKISIETAEDKVYEYIDKFINKDRVFKDREEVFEYASNLLKGAVDWVEDNYEVVDLVGGYDKPWYCYWDEWVHYITDDFIEKLDD